MVLARNNNMAWECFYCNWAIAFLVTGIVLGLIVGSVPGDVTETQAYTSQLFSYGGICYGYSMLGGILMNMANVLLCKGVGLLGQALGFPMSTGIGLISGSIVAYIIEPEGTELSFLVVGNLIALLGIFSIGLLAKRKEDELPQGFIDTKGSDEAASESPARYNLEIDARTLAAGSQATKQVSMLRKFLICVAAGLLLGLSNIGVVNAYSKPCSMSAPANQTFYSIGLFLSSTVLIPLTVWFPVEGGAATTSFAKIRANYRQTAWKEHALSIVGGSFLCIGCFAFTLANGTRLGPAAAYSIGQSAPVVGILWGTFFFKEFRGTTARVWGIIPAIVALFIGAIVCLASAAK